MYDTEVYLIGTLLTVLAGLAYSEWRIRRFRAHFAQNALQTLQDAFFDEDVVQVPNGTKRVLLRPNERLALFLSQAGPGLMEWAAKNVKITLPSFTLPEGVDLKTVGMSALAQKVMSGKKLKLEDALPLGLGYVKEWLDKTGILQTLGAKKPVKAEEAVNPYLKELSP